jgi:hypothetical protein
MTGVIEVSMGDNAGRVIRFGAPVRHEGDCRSYLVIHSSGELGEVRSWRAPV